MGELSFLHAEESLSFIDEAYALFIANRITPWSMSSFKSSLKNDLSTIACIDSHLSGFVIVSSVLDHAEIEDICVDSSKRNQGIASRLLEHLVFFAKEKGISEIFLEVDEHNVNAIGLYNKLGFRQVGRRKGYYPSSLHQSDKVSKNVDAILMQKSIA